MKMKKLLSLLLVLAVTAALHAQVTVSNVANNPNGTLANSTDDYIAFQLYATPPSTTYISPFTYKVTAMQGSNPVAVLLADGSAATNVRYYATGDANSFRLPAGTAGKGNVTITVTPNFTGYPLQTGTVADPGSFYQTACGSGRQSITYKYISPRSETEAEHWVTNIPKFDPSNGQTLTGVSIKFSGTVNTYLLFENGSNGPINIYGNVTSNISLDYNTGAGAANITNGDAVVWTRTSGNKLNIPAGKFYPNPVNTWLGDVTTPPFTIGSGITRMTTDGWLKPTTIAGLDPTVNPKWITTATGDATAADDMYNGGMVTQSYSNNAITIASGDLSKYTGTGIIPIEYNTLSGYSFTGGGGNLQTNLATTTQFSVEVTYTYTNNPCYNVSGTVFNDYDGASNGINNLAGITTGLGLNAVLVDDNGVVVDVVPVSAGGTYTLGNCKASANYHVIITTNAATKGAAAPAVALPAGWVSTGEQNGGGTGTDGTINGQSAAFTMPAANVTQRDFGIEQLPETVNRDFAVAQPISGAIAAGTIASNATSAVVGSDPEDGALGNPQTIVIRSLSNNGTAYYNGTAITVGQVITGFDPTKLSYTGLAQGTTSAQFNYAFRDAAGMEDPTPAYYKVSWPTPLPVVFGTVEAILSNGELVVNFVSETEHNNDHFEIEASVDGANFRTIGTVASKAENGNSNSAISYQYTVSGTGLMGMWGWAGLMFALVMVSLAFGRKNKIFRTAMMVVAVSLLGTVSCSKQAGDVQVDGVKKVWVRVAQVDKDGTKKYSKVVIATQKN